MVILSRIPGVEGGDAGGGEVGGVASDDRHVVNQRGCGDDGVVFRTRVGDVQGCGSSGNFNVKREDASGEGVQNVLIESCTEYVSLRRVAATNL